MHNDSFVFTKCSKRKSEIDLSDIRKRNERLLRISEEGSALEEKIDMIRKTTKHLKDKLAHEKEELESAKWKLPAAQQSTYSLYHQQQMQQLMPTYSSLMSIPNLPRPPPTPPYYYPCPGDYGYQYMMYGQMSPMLPPQRPLTALDPFSSLVAARPSRCITPVSMHSGMYTHLNEVDRLCEEEFVRMQRQIKNLKKLKKSWDDSSSYETPSSYRRRRKLRKHRN